MQGRLSSGSAYCDDVAVMSCRKSSAGVWSKDLKRHTNIAQTQVNKILKTLESRQLIKSVKSVNAGNKKILVLFELEPASEVTGGLW